MEQPLAAEFTVAAAWLVNVVSATTGLGPLPAKVLVSAAIGGAGWLVLGGLGRLSRRPGDGRLAQALTAVAPVLNWAGPLAGGLLALTPWTIGHPGRADVLAVTMLIGVWVIITWALQRLAARLTTIVAAAVAITASRYDDLVVDLAGRCLRGLIPLLSLYLGVRTTADSPLVAAIADRALGIAVVLGLAWAIWQAVGMLDRFVMAGHRLDVTDNLHARQLLTQSLVAKRVLYVVVAVVAMAGILVQFDGVRQIGTAMLASAGVASLVIGLAAQRTLGNIFAGIQIALTRPINLDDVVIIEGEWGRIEEIHLTYIVVAIWDQRRLVVPISHFIEKPFQNWTRTSAEILGTVFIHVDYTCDIAAVRNEVQRQVADHPLWDQRVANVQVTESTAHSLQVRLLISAVDSGKAWDLRCDLRERMIAWLRTNHPAWLPRERWISGDDRPSDHHRVATAVVPARPS